MRNVPRTMKWMGAAIVSLAMIGCGAETKSTTAARNYYGNDAVMAGQTESGLHRPGDYDSGSPAGGNRVTDTPTPGRP